MYSEQAMIGALVADFGPKVKQHSETFKKHSVSLKDPNSKWKVSSALQKSIRRGLVERASYYAQSLINGGQSDYFWRRIPVVALEDVGPGDLDLCAFTLALARFSALRKPYNELALADFLVTEMARGVKSRGFCDLMCSWTFDQGAQFNNASDHVVEMRAEAFTHAHLLGVVEGKEGAKNLSQFNDMALEGEAPITRFIVESGIKRSVHGLHSSVVALTRGIKEDKVHIHEQTLPHNMLGAMPDFAYDQFTLEGKKVMSYLVKSLELAEKWPALASSEKLSMAVFQVESAQLNRKLASPTLDELQAFNDTIELLSVDIPIEQHQPIRQFLASDEVQAELLRVRKRILKLD